MNKYIVFLLSALLFAACKTDSPKPTSDSVKKAPVKIPAFNSDNAYDFVAKQVDFGIRLPGTPTHTACKNWIVDKMKSYGADIIEQDFTAQIYTGDSWPSTNIICQFNPKIKDRIILSAHWDTRFKAEQDPDESMRDEPILGADDAGSGVGVLMKSMEISTKHGLYKLFRQ